MNRASRFRRRHRALRARAGRESGLTLVELLVSVILVAVITAFLASALTTGRRAFAADRAASGAASASAALDSLATLVAGALPAPSGQGTSLAFDGRSDGVSFVGLSLGHALPGGPLTFHLRRRGQDLVVAVAPAPGGAPLAGQADSVVLRRIEGLDIRYFGSAAPNAAPAWQREWRGRDQLPELVSIAVRGAHGRQPPLVVRLRQG